MMSAEQRRLAKQLKAIIRQQPNSIKAAVAHEALDYDTIEAFFSDLLQHGCQSGMIGSLIYYSDTHKFFDTHYDEIEDLRYELEQSLGEALQPKGGYEISIPNPQKGDCFKTSIRPKSPTTFRNKISSKLLVFEGMWDFLSWLEMQQTPEPEHNVIVLNSLSFCGLVVQQIIKMREQVDTVTLFLDNDDAGEKAKYFMEEELDIANFNVRTMEQLYKGYKDLNEYWVKN